MNLLLVMQLLAVLCALRKAKHTPLNSCHAIQLSICDDMSGSVLDGKQPLFSFKNEDDLISGLYSEIGELTFEKMKKEMNLDK